MSKQVQLKVYLDRNLATKFRELIQQKYPKYEKGLLSYEVDAALRHWLSLHTGAQNTILPNKPNPTPKVVIAFAQVKNYLLNGLYYELKSGQQLPVRHLHQAIMAVRGSDKRTVEKWMKVFDKMGLIKATTSVTWEIL